MKSKKRSIAREIIADLKEMHATLKKGIPLRAKYAVRAVRAAHAQQRHDADRVRNTLATDHDST